MITSGKQIFRIKVYLIAFGQQAEAAIKTLGYKNVIFLPHPVSFKWRKSLILDLKEKLITESLNP